jgi:hypothetical protein
MRKFRATYLDFQNKVHEQILWTEDAILAGKIVKAITDVRGNAIVKEMKMRKGEIPEKYENKTK